MGEEKALPLQGKQSGTPPSHATTSTSTTTATHPASSSATPTNTAPTPTMSPFPAEVLDMVLEYLPHRHLVKCVRVNSLFYDVAIKRLYRTVVLKRNGPWPTLVGPENGRSTNPARQNTRLRGAQLVKYVRIVEVKPHDANVCAYYPRQRDTRTLGSPRALQVVRVILPDVVGSRDLHLSSSNLRCYFTQDLRPTTLVVRNVPFAFRSALNASTICNHLASRYVYVVTPDKQPFSISGDCRVWPARASGMYGLLYSLPEGTTELVVVFHTPGPTFYWRTQPPLNLPLNRGWVDASAWPNLVPQIDHDLLKSVAHLDKTWLRYVVADLAKFVRGFRPIGDDDAAWSGPSISNLRVTLVNTSSLGPAGWGSSGPLRYDMQTILYWSLYDAVHTSNKDEMERRMDRVTFLTMEEFFEGEDWFGVFEPEEAAPWMKQKPTEA